MLRLSTLIGITVLVPAVHAADVNAPTPKNNDVRVNITPTQDRGVQVGVTASPTDDVKLGGNVTLYPGPNIVNGVGLGVQGQVNITDSLNLNGNASTASRNGLSSSVTGVGLNYKATDRLSLNTQRSHVFQGNTTTTTNGLGLNYKPTDSVNLGAGANFSSQTMSSPYGTYTSPVQPSFGFNFDWRF